MPRYYFHVREDDDVLHDPDGKDCADLVAAKAEAAAVARGLMAGGLRSARPLGLWREIVIADEAGHTLATVPFRDALRPGQPALRA
jgi:hypothetical protein